MSCRTNIIPFITILTLNVPAPPRFMFTRTSTIQYKSTNRRTRQFKLNKVFNEPSTYREHFIRKLKNKY